MRTVNLTVLVAFCALIMSLAWPAGAVTWYVDPNGSANFTTIQAALDDPCTVDDDQIEVAPATYNEAINFNGKAVRLYSSDGLEVTIIDGTGHYHVVQCVSGEDANTILEGFTITGGDANGGGSNDYGGGMYNSSSSPTVTNCTFSSNSASIRGGGVYNYLSNPNITNCTFSKNSAINGGGINNHYGNSTITNCTFSDNSARRGAGIDNHYSDSNTTNCTFSNNPADYGCGIYSHAGSPTVTNCTFTDNSTAYYGGGMYNSSSSPTVTNCTFSNNSASIRGGGVYNNLSNPNVTNCTFSNNSADYGGGMYNYDSNSLVTNCILWGDTPHEIYDFNSATTVTYSDVQGGWLGAGSNNIDDDPCFVNADANDFRLLRDSPCIDAGDNSSVIVATDLTGNPRIVDGDRDDTATVDMGAFELPPEIHNITQDTWYETIQTAIDDADLNDEIEVSPGKYNEAINFNGKVIRLYSSGGPDVTTIDGTGHYHVVQCISGEDANTILAGFTITGGNANGSSFPDNYGGGMFNNYSSPTVINCTFSGNSASYDGGGISNSASDPNITNCTFSKNSAMYGGGMESYSSSPTVTNCIFINNSASEWGGGIAIGESSPTVTNCTFISNSASCGGGCENFWCNSNATNCTFSNNSATDSGGGICNHGSNLNLTNCTFSGNIADANGGGMCNYDSNSLVTNCILWGDTAAVDGNEIALVQASTLDVNYCDVKGGQADIYKDGSSTVTWGININADPLFVDPCNPDPNLWNLRLKPDSPCIDAANNDLVPADTNDLDNDGNTAESIPFDLDGHTRFVDGDCNDTDIVDMGAYEFNLVYYGDFDSDCDVDVDDIAVLCDEWLLREFLWDVVEDGCVNFLDWAIFADGWPDRYDLFDLAKFADEWLRRPITVCDIAPYVGDGIVNLADYAVLADNWLASF